MTPALTPAEVFTNLAAALFVIPLVFGFVFKAPKLVVFSFIFVLFVFSDSTWGQLEAETTIYSRGSGMFYFSLLNLVLLACGIAVMLKRLATPHGPLFATPMAKYVFAFLFLLFGHVVVGLMEGIELNVILGYSGIINVLNMLVFMSLVVMAFDSRKDTHRLMLAIILLAAARAIFGGIRYFLFDGDTANPYRNFEGIDIKIFFFDISDNFVASLGAFCAAWLLTAPEAKLSWFKRTLLLGFLILEIAAVALSFRRSSLIGLGLMFVFLFLRIPGGRKILFALVGAGLLALVATIFYEHRLQFASGESVLSSLIYDISPDRGIRNSRFYELYAAAESMDGNWLFGRGTWGTFTGDRERLSYHGDDFGFVHSGFGHMVLKTGIVGLLMFCALLGTYIAFYMRHRNRLTGDARLVADCGFAGFLFWVPTLLIGTPIIEFRTMLLLGLTLAMPFVAVGLRYYQARRYQIDPHYVAA